MTDNTNDSQWQVPTTLPYARAELETIFMTNCNENASTTAWGKDSKTVQRALTLLRAFPKLAKLSFSYSSLLPLSHFLMGGTVDLQIVKEVYSLFPEALSSTTIRNGMRRSSLPLDCACKVADEGSEEIIEFLVQQFPGARVQQVNGPRDTPRHTECPPFHYYVNRLCSLQNIEGNRLVEDRETMWRICNLIWRNGELRERLQKDPLEPGPLMSAISANCQPLIPLFLSKIPKDCWGHNQVFSLNFSGSLTEARGLTTVLSQLTSLELVFFGPIRSGHGAFQHLMNSLARNVSITKLTLRLAHPPPRPRKKARLDRLENRKGVCGREGWHFQGFGRGRQFDFGARTTARTDFYRFPPS